MENTYTHKTHTPEFINKQMDKKGLNKLLAQIYLEYGGGKTAELANTLKNLGYRYATKSLHFLYRAFSRRRSFLEIQF